MSEITKSSSTKGKYDFIHRNLEAKSYGGYLEKKSATKGTWIKRYVLLSNGTLKYGLSYFKIKTS
jgi:hypothetical protein